jgi:hypothetical protein
MNHALAMRVRERAGHLSQESYDVRYRQAPLALETSTEAFAIGERHRVVQHAAAKLAGGEQWNDVRMLESSGEPHFP